jgi:flagellar basal-body rod modification protein FlgD
MSPISSPSSSTANSNNSQTSDPQSATVDKNMFLQLLVAQLQNQDPLNPTDSSQFVTQLAQFQQLEASVNMEQDVSDIRQNIDQYFPAANGNGGNSQNSGTAGSSQTQS